MLPKGIPMNKFKLSLLMVLSIGTSDSALGDYQRENTIYVCHNAQTNPPAVRSIVVTINNACYAYQKYMQQSKAFGRSGPAGNVETCKSTTSVQYYDQDGNLGPSHPAAFDVIIFNDSFGRQRLVGSFSPRALPNDIDVTHNDFSCVFYKEN